MLKTIFNWILPITCVVCHQTSPDYFCSGCLGELPWLYNPCKLCANEISKFPDSVVCGECLINPPHFAKMIALFRYDFPIPSLIAQLKFRKKLSLGSALGSLLAQKVIQSYLEDTLPECVIPVPLHKKRLVERGYNQALEIVRSFKKMGIAVHFRDVERKIATMPQTLINVEERAKNVKGAFVVRPGFNYRHVAIIDDVVTTGSTIAEFAAVLKKNGVERVDVWCIARVNLD